MSRGDSSFKRPGRKDGWTAVSMTAVSMTDCRIDGCFVDDLCLSSEKLTTPLTELLTIPRWNNWCEYPSSRRSRMGHVPSRALQLVSTCAACSSCRFSSEKGVIGWFAHSRSCCSTSK